MVIYTLTCLNIASLKERASNNNSSLKNESGLEEYTNDRDRDLLLEISIIEDDDASATSGRSSGECRASSGTDRADLYEVTIVPAVPSRVTSSNGTFTAPPARILNAERENRRDYGSKTRDSERSEKTERRRPNGNNNNNSRDSLNSDERSRIRGDEGKLAVGGMEDGKCEGAENRGRIEGMHARSRVLRDANGESSEPFVELGALYKILAFVTDADPRVATLTSGCRGEISRALRYLTERRRSDTRRLEELLLASDPTLRRCECCGVISCLEALEARPYAAAGGGGIEGPGAARRDDYAEITIAERDRTNRRHERIGMLADGGAEVVDPSRARYKDDSNGTASSPDEARAGGPGAANNIADTVAHLANAKLAKDTPHPDNNVIERLFADFADFAATSETRGNEYSRLVESSHVPTKAPYADKERILRKISYEIRKSSVDGNFFRGPRPPFERADDVPSCIDTVKYLARGEFAFLDAKGERDVLSGLRLREGRRARPPEDAPRRRSFVLHGSRDDCPRPCESGFWLFDKSGRLPEAIVPDDGDYRRLLPRRLYDGDGFRARRNSIQRLRASASSRRTAECAERDSLENCGPRWSAERGRESVTTAFSSSSAENLLYQWMGSLDRKTTDDTSEDEDAPRGRRLTASRPSLDIARHVRAEKNEGRFEAREATRDTFDRSVSPAGRGRIRRLFESTVPTTGEEDSSLARTTDAPARNGKEKSLRSRSADGSTFARPDKSFAVGARPDDRVPTKLSELAEGTSRTIERQDDGASAPNRAGSKDLLEISHERSTVSPALGKVGLADDSTRKIVRRVVYDDASTKGDVIGDEILAIYRKILENSENMDWDGFRELVEALHPGQRELWRDVCKTIDEETNRVVGDANGGSAEIRIEISPIREERSPEEVAPGTSQATAYTREIVFELDVTLRDVEGLLDKGPRLAEERLDTHKDADEGATPTRGNGGRRPISKQTR